MEFIEFTSKKRTFRHIRDGWCAREVRGKWRMFWGQLQPGAPRPAYVNAYQQPDGEEFVELPSFEKCVDWVEQRSAEKGA